MSDTGQGGDKDISDVQNVETDAPFVVPPLIGDVSLDKMLSDEVSTERTPEEIKKLKQYSYAGLAGLCLIILFTVYSCQPAKGSMAFGICSTFLEIMTPYPQTLNYTGFDGSRTAVRIYYTHIDPFGQFKSETLECKFGPDQKMGMKVTQVLRNRRPIDLATIDEFNLSLPTIMASDPYRVLPPHWKNPLLRNGPPLHETHELPF